MAGFSLVRASEDAVRGRKGKITFDNVFTDLNGNSYPLEWKDKKQKNVSPQECGILELQFLRARSQVWIKRWNCSRIGQRKNINYF